MSSPGMPVRLSLAALMAFTAIGCGGCSRGHAGKFEDLFISNQRYVIDADKGQVHIYGQLQNTGGGRFRQAEVHAVLRSAGGDKRGENSLILEHLQPQEKRLFAMTVTSHGRVARVDLSVRKPEAP